MIGEKLRFNRTGLVVIDLCATYLALSLAFHLRFEVEVFPVTKGIPPFTPYLALFPIITLIWPVMFYFRGLLEGRPQRSLVEEAFAVTVAVGLASIVLYAGLGFYRDFTYSRLTLGLFAVLDVALVTLGRAGFWKAQARLWASSRHRKHALVAGAGELGRMAAAKLVEHRELGLDVVGFLDDNPGKVGMHLDGIPVLGTLDELDAVTHAHHVKMLYVALPLGAQRRAVKLLKAAEPLLLDVRVVPDLLQYYALRAGVEDLDGLPVINLTQIPLAGWNRLVKRTADVVVASFGLLALSPLLAIIAAFVKRHDGGPVFYRQLRMGLDGKSF